MNFDTRNLGQRPLQYSGFVIAGNVDVMKARKKSCVLGGCKDQNKNCDQPLGKLEPISRAIPESIC